MDDQVLSMMRDRFDSIDSTLKAMNASLTTHVEKDERYWLKIDQQQAQISLIRWLFGGGAVAAIVGWVIDRALGGR